MVYSLILMDTLYGRDRNIWSILDDDDDDDELCIEKISLYSQKS